MEHRRIRRATACRAESPLLRRSWPPEVRILESGGERRGESVWLRGRCRPAAHSTGVCSVRPNLPEKIRNAFRLLLQRLQASRGCRCAQACGGGGGG